jgi:hypothetical protein
LAISGKGKAKFDPESLRLCEMGLEIEINLAKIEALAESNKNYFQRILSNKKTSLTEEELKQCDHLRF